MSLERFKNHIFDLVIRGYCVIVIDPKGDKVVREICRYSVGLDDQPERFLMLDPACAAESVRLDVLKNWNQVSDVASRIAMAIDSDGSDNLSQFCWMAVHRITSGLKFVGRGVSLYTLKNLLESRTSVEQLTEMALKQFFQQECPKLLEAVDKEIYASSAAGGRAPSKSTVETSSVELSAMIKVFQSEVPDTQTESTQRAMPMKPEEVRGLITILEANKQWYDQMVVVITPILTKLTTDALRGLLSPDYEDINDHRPIMDGKRLVQCNHILYVATDTLADASVRKALTKMIYGEISLAATHIYDHSWNSNAVRVIAAEHWGCNDGKAFYVRPSIPSNMQPL
jgi:conjugal transfer pilus assembly protein TraD